jgi:hypothetical protein
MVKFLSWVWFLLPILDKWVYSAERAPVLSKDFIDFSFVCWFKSRGIHILTSMGMWTCTSFRLKTFVLILRSLLFISYSVRFYIEVILSVTICQLTYFRDDVSNIASLVDEGYESFLEGHIFKDLRVLLGWLFRNFVPLVVRGKKHSELIS